MSHKIIVISGSIRKDSMNTKLAKNIVILFEKLNIKGVEIKFLDLANYPIPIYNGDIEEIEGIPDNVFRLQKTFLEHDGFIFCSPEYNGFFPPIIKNLIDWLSRPFENHPPKFVFQNKYVSLCSVVPKIGGLRGLASLKSLLLYVGMIINPKMVAISYDNFSLIDNNSVDIDQKYQDLLNEMLNNMLSLMHINKHNIH